MYKNVTKVPKTRIIKMQFKYTIVRANVGLTFYSTGTLGRRGGKDGRNISQAESQPSVSSILVSSSVSKF